MTIPTDTLLLTAHQASELLGLAASTLAKMRLRGDGPRYVKLGVSVRYPVSALEAYVASAPLRRSTSEYLPRHREA